jgi:predicted Rossmann fold flavoprotein
MQTRYETLIIGAGAAGMMAAAHLDRPSTLILEGNDRAGAKLAITGGGRCNLTHIDMGADHFVPRNRFVASVLAEWGVDESLAFFRRLGVTPVEEKNGQFFIEQGAKALTQALRSAIRHARWVQGCRVRSLVQTAEGFRAETDCGRFDARQVIVATGGLSFPKLGATDIGYRIARHFGHEVRPTVPALVGMTLQPEQFFFKSLSGIAVAVRITVEETVIEGDLLFAHRGISGPAVLNASLYWSKGAITIDFLPGYDRQSIRTSRKHLTTLLPLPRRAARAFLAHLQLTDRPAHRLGAAEWERLETLRRYRFAPAGRWGYAKAEVTRGGVATDAIDPRTLRSRRVPGLYFVGEVLDVTGELGGYNLHWAFASAIAASRAIAG